MNTFCKVLRITCILCLFVGCSAKQPSDVGLTDEQFGPFPDNFYDMVKGYAGPYFAVHGHAGQRIQAYYVSPKPPEKKIVNKDIWGWHGELAVQYQHKEKSLYALYEYFIRRDKIIIDTAENFVVSITKSIFALGTLGLSTYVTGDLAGKKAENLAKESQVYEATRQLPRSYSQTIEKLQQPQLNAQREQQRLEAQKEQERLAAQRAAQESEEQRLREERAKLEEAKRDEEERALERQRLERQREQLERERQEQEELARQQERAAQKRKETQAAEQNVKDAFSRATE
ncbi:MAG: hypothetical protein IJU37_01095 [Desulfovibrio sp.]|nr:hypothetical protein [Desulfovibrio sp.]